jgi:hypothetical protein
MILSSFYLMQQGQVMPLAAVVVIAFLGWLMFKRVAPSVVSQPPADPNAPAFTVFRDMEPADQTRVNVWTGFLQEDVYKNRTGPIGNFVGNIDISKNAPLYPFDEGADISTGGTARNCPNNGNCSCFPSRSDPSKTQCGFLDSGNNFNACPSDCCTPACYY